MPRPGVPPRYGVHYPPGSGDVRKHDGGAATQPGRELAASTNVRESGANLFWRWFQIPALLAGPHMRRFLERAIWLDGELFDRANLFLSARSEP